MHLLQNISTILLKARSRKALNIKGEFYTYGNLSDGCMSIKNELTERKIKNQFIGIVINNDIQTYASILAVLFSGNGFVAINPKHPQQRNDFIMKDSEITLLLNSSENKTINELSQKNNIKIIDTEKLQDFQLIFSINTHKDQPAYMLYTSGTTGTPKGVPISLINFFGFLYSFIYTDYEYDSNDNVLQAFDLTFDVGIANFFMALIVGSCLYVVPDDEIKYLSVSRLLSEENIRIAAMPPSLLAYLKPHFDELQFKNLTYCILTAEASHHSLLKEWKKCVPNAKIINLYGPTEASVWALVYEWTGNETELYNDMIPIGKPLQNIDILIVDNENKPVKSGQKGELCLTGLQVTKGYKNAELNKIAFFTHNDQNYYKTGDIVFENKNRDIMYCGRKDNQVQIQGFRVELSEIEFHARQFTGCNNLAAVPFQNTKKILQVALFIENSTKNEQEINQYLKTNLPAYMMPTKIINLEKMPLNSNEKIDKPKLKKQLENNQ